jgi:glyceraldehyde 3-phosphate dehydrogenase
MSHKIAINGFGRIGRGILRSLVESGNRDLDVVAINDLGTPEQLAHMLQYDSVHGVFKADISATDDAIEVNGQTIRVSAIRDPDALDWQGVDVTFECTGRFNSYDQAARHLKNGSRKVLVSAPTKGVKHTVVYGVNHTDLTAEDMVVSNASCTTNCLAPVAMVLDQEFGIKTGYMTTVHAYTGSQPTLDSQNDDPYRGRAAGLSMIPTTTGATRALSLVLPQLEGKIEGSAIRVPTPNVSVVDLSFMPERPATVETVNAAMKAAAMGPLKGVLSYSERPLVSIDFNHDPHSSCFAPAQTAVTNQGMVRVLSWYDNEWGFANRMIDTGTYLANL